MRRARVSPRSPAGEDRPRRPSSRPPAPSPPRHCAALAALRGLQQTWAPPSNRSRATAWRARGRPGPPPPDPDCGRRSALTSGGAGGRGRRARRLPLECAGRRGARALRLFPETPPGGVRPTRLGRLLTPAATPLPRPPRADPSPSLPLRALPRRSRGAEPEAPQHSTGILGDTDTQERASHLPTLAWVGPGMEEPMWGRGSRGGSAGRGRRRWRSLVQGPAMRSPTVILSGGASSPCQAGPLALDLKWRMQAFSPHHGRD